MKSDVLSVLDLFEVQKRYLVPLFQRQYVWSKEKQWRPLWEDVERKVIDRLHWEELGGGRENDPVIKSSPGEHFLGAIVLDQHPVSGKQVQARVLIDGQQRLTTCQVILASLRDVARERGEEEYAKVLETFLINSGIMADKEVERYKVWPSTYDQPAFKAVIEGSIDAALYGSIKLVEAYFFFREKIEEFLDSDPSDGGLKSVPDATKRISALFDTFRHDLQIVSIQLEGQDDPQVIFETLNARGEPLLASDLLRNYLFWRASRAKEPVDALYETYWQHFDTDFWKKEERQGRLTRPRVDLFFYNLLEIKSGALVNVTRLYYEYREWSEKVAKYRSAEDELAEINRYSPHAQALLSPSDESDLGRFAQVLLTFDVRTILPLVMKLLTDGDLDAQDLKIIYSDLSSYIIRRQICGLSAASYTRNFVNWVGQMNKDSALMTSEGLRSLMLGEDAEHTVWPDDSRLHHAWMNDQQYSRLKSNGRLEYILRQIELALRTRKHEDVTIHSKLTIEHDMPQSWITHWRLPDGSMGLSKKERVLTPSPESDNRDRAVQTIGNLTLLTLPANSDNSHLPFTDKIEKMFENSTLLMNRELKQRGDKGKGWDEAAIEERGRRLFDLAVKIWPHPGTSA